MKEINAGKTALHDPIYMKGTVDGIEVEAAIQFVDTFEENILGFCNNIFTQEGGTHLAGFKTKFTMLINSYARELGILKEKDANFTGADTRNGMTAVIAVKHPDPIFEGQTKTKLASADATKAVFTLAGDELQRFFDRNIETLKAVISCAEKSSKDPQGGGEGRRQICSQSRVFPLTVMESWPTARAGMPKSVRFLLLREIQPAARPRWEETGSIRRFFLSGERF